MTIDLAQFVGKKVTVTFRSGEKATDVLFARENTIWPYRFWGHTYQKEGNEGYSQSPYDIIHIELAEKPEMKKYEQLESKIAELQKEVEHLKSQEKEEEEQKDKLPNYFVRPVCLEFLKSKDPVSLDTAFRWISTPQGYSYWDSIYEGKQPITDADIIQIQKWVIMSFEQEQGE